MASRRRVFLNHVVPKRQLKIMVVDDHAAFRGLVKGILGIAGWECVECEDGQAAVERYGQARPGLVLMDIAMEHLDGISATRQIKARFPEARIMILSQFDDPDLRSAADEAGACAYLLKENLLGLRAVVEMLQPDAPSESPDPTEAQRD